MGNHCLEIPAFTVALAHGRVSTFTGRHGQPVAS
jgi:hypothetical protein